MWKKIGKWILGTILVVLLVGGFLNIMASDFAKKHFRKEPVIMEQAKQEPAPQAEPASQSVPEVAQPTPAPQPAAPPPAVAVEEEKEQEETAEEPPAPAPVVKKAVRKHCNKPHKQVAKERVVVKTEIIYINSPTPPPPTPEPPPIRIVGPVPQRMYIPAPEQESTGIRVGRYINGVYVASSIEEERRFAGRPSRDNNEYSQPAYRQPVSYRQAGYRQALNVGRQYGGQRYESRNYGRSARNYRYR